MSINHIKQQIGDAISDLASLSYQLTAQYHINPGHESYANSAVRPQHLSDLFSGQAFYVLNKDDRAFRFVYQMLCNTPADWNLVLVNTCRSIDLNKVEEAYQKALNLLNEYSIKPLKYANLFTENYGAYSANMLVVSTTNLPKLIFFPLENNHQATFPDKLITCNLSKSIFNDKDLIKPVKTFIANGKVNVAKTDLINLDNEESALAQTQEIINQAITNLKNIKCLRIFNTNFNYAIDLTPITVLLLNIALKYTSQYNSSTYDLDIEQFDDFNINVADFFKNESKLAKYLAKYI